MIRFAYVTAISALLLTVPALSQPAHPPKQGAHDHHAEKASDSASTSAFRAANDKMHKDMDITYSGNADVDFIKGMIPHHNGAVDMAQIVLKYGKDAEVRKLAEGIIKAQATEIAFMKAWLEKQKK